MKSKFKILIGALCVCIAAFACVWAFTAGGLDISSSGKIVFTQKADTPELTLVNADHAVPRGWNVELTTLSNGEQVASMIYPDLQEMFDDMRAQGIYPFVRAGYRSRETQEQVLEDRIASYQSEGYSKSRARELALETVAEPGTSEHELGLAVDINADDDRSTGDEVYAWLAENAYKYGFIQRYPEDKTEITGIDHEPWHYRYVGKSAAGEIYNSGECLEEYLGEN